MLCLSGFEQYSRWVPPTFIRDQSACAQFNTNPNQQCVQVVKNIAKQVESSCGQKVCPGLITRIVSTYSKVSITL